MTPDGGSFIDGLLSTPRHRNALVFVLLAAVWGGTFPAVTVGLDAFPPILYAAIRFDIAAALLLGYAVVRFDYWQPRERADWVAVLAGGLFMLAGYSVLLNVGQGTVPSTIAAVLAGLIPLLTVGFAKVLLPEEAFGPAELLGVGLGFAGLVVITHPDPANLLTANTLGQGILVVAAASFALGGVVTQWADAAMPFAPRTGWAMAVGALVTHLASLLSPDESVALVDPSGRGLLGLLYLAVFVSALGYLLYFDLLPRLGSVELNLVTYGAAAFGTVFGWLLFGDPVTTGTLAGFLLVLLGFAVLKREQFAEEWASYLKRTRAE